MTVLKQRNDVIEEKRGLEGGVETTKPQVKTMVGGKFTVVVPLQNPMRVDISARDDLKKKLNSSLI